MSDRSTLISEDSLIDAPEVSVKRNKILEVLLKVVLFVVRYFVTIAAANFGIIPDKEKLDKTITNVSEFVVKHWVRILIICIGVPFTIVTASVVFLMIFG